MSSELTVHEKLNKILSLLEGKPKKNKWIPFNPSEMPKCLRGGFQVKIKLRNGEKFVTDPLLCNWCTIPSAKAREIVAYKKV